MKALKFIKKLPDAEILVNTTPTGNLSRMGLRTTKNEALKRIRGDLKSDMDNQLNKGGK